MNQKTFNYFNGILVRPSRISAKAQKIKVFCFFFSKKKAFLPVSLPMHAVGCNQPCSAPLLAPRAPA
jgi:hypothetical protein